MSLSCLAQGPLFCMQQIKVAIILLRYARKFISHWLQENTCAFVLWWPHLGVRRYTKTECIQLLDQIWRLASLKLHLLLFKLEKISPNTVGISEELAYDILDQLPVHPTSIQLERLLKDLTAIWTTPAGREFNNEPVHDYQDIQNLELYPVKDETEISTLPEDPERYLLPDNIAQRLPTISLAEMMHSWSLNNQVSFTNRAIKMVPNLHALPEAQKVKHMTLP
jgi:hypothetical protein